MLEFVVICVLHVIHHSPMLVATLPRCSSPFVPSLHSPLTISLRTAHTSKLYRRYEPQIIASSPFQSLSVLVVLCSRHIPWVLLTLHTHIMSTSLSNLTPYMATIHTITPFIYVNGM